MRVVALASQKGGTGKTSLAGHLAVQAHLAGAGPVVLIETDPQGTLVDWWDARPEADIGFVESHMGRLAADLAALREDGHRLALVDTPTGNPIVIQAALQQADLAIIPVRPGPHDLKAVGPMLDLCDRAGKPVVFVLNAVPPEGQMADSVATALGQHGHVMPQWIAQDAGVAEAMAHGMTLMEIDPDRAVSHAVDRLWEQLCQRADANFRRTIFSSAPSNNFVSVNRSSPIGFGRRQAG